LAIFTVNVAVFRGKNVDIELFRSEQLWQEPKGTIYLGKYGISHIDAIRENFSSN
jgi:hypothetical protein